MSTLELLVAQRLGTLDAPPTAPALALVLPGGRRIGPADAPVTLRLASLAPLAHVAAGQVGRLAEDYVEGRIDIEGAMRPVIDVAARLVRDDPTRAAEPPGPLAWWRDLMHRGKSLKRHRAEADARQVQFHYDVSDDFYALWLDPRRVYSCAYFRRPEMTLAQAQEAKLEHICRKLMLRPGERFLDIGAGWGGLLLWAAEHHGVRATGITLSKNQHAHVNRLIDERGLRGRVEMRLLDYRDLPEDEPFDKIASVGMFEHVGRAKLPRYFDKIRRLLRARRAAAEPRHHRRRHAQHPARRRHRRLHRALHLPRRRAAARVARAAGHGRAGAGRRWTPRTCARTTRARCGAGRDGLEAQLDAGAAHHRRQGGARLPAVPGRQRDELRARLAVAAPDAGGAAQRAGR